MTDKAYYSLLVRFNESEFWSVQFGDYDRETVEDERDDMQHGSEPVYAFKIIKTKPDQASIKAKVESINSMLEPV